MRYRLRTLLIVLALGACSVQKDKAIKFESDIGNSLIAPSDWKSDDRGAVWYLESPDGQTAISVFTFTVEGSGSLDDIKSLMISHRIAQPDADSTWRESARPSLSLKQGETQVVDLIPSSGESKSRNRLYLLQTGTMYHVIVVNSSEAVLSLNGPFYDSIIQSFHGRE
jgi:hypothetical protein